MEQLKSTTTVLDRQVDRFKDYSSQSFEYVNSKDLGTIVTKRSSKTTSQVNVKYNALGLVRMIVLVSIVALLGFLLIYNLVAMSQISANIATTETLIASEQASVDVLKEKLLALDSEAVIMDKVANAGYSAGAGTIVNSNAVVPEVAPITYDKQTNWFDKICEFISSIFGGTW